MAASKNYRNYQNSGRANGRYYNAGSVAYELQPEKIRRSKEEYIKESESVIEARVKTHQHEGRAFTHVQSITIAVCVIVLCAMSVWFVDEAVLLRESRRSAASLATGYQTLVHDNALTEDRIANSVDLAYIYEEATERLGMALPEKNQVVVYGKASSEYVEKNAEIPND